MKECWVNVYFNGKHPYIMGDYHSTLKIAIECYKTAEPIYRIHVRLK